MTAFEALIAVDGAATSAGIFATLCAGVYALLGLEPNVVGFLLVGNLLFATLFVGLGAKPALDRITGVDA